MSALLHTFLPDPQSRELLSAEGLRVDGRRPGELRKISVELGVLPNVDGSCLYTQGYTKVLATVVGPQDGRSNQKRVMEAVIECEYAVTPFAAGVRRDMTKGSRASKESALIIQQTFERVVLRSLFPQSVISINVLVLHNAGSALACAINAVTAALMDAGVPMRDVVVAATGSVVDTVPILDVNATERGGAGSQVTVAVEALTGKIVTLQSEARISVEALEAVVELGTAGCGLIAEIIRENVRKDSELDPATVA
jgi:exosome complex component RRP41